MTDGNGGAGAVSAGILHESALAMEVTDPGATFGFGPVDRVRVWTRRPGASPVGAGEDRIVILRGHASIDLWAEEATVEVVGAGNGCVDRFRLRGALIRSDGDRVVALADRIVAHDGPGVAG